MIRDVQSSESQRRTVIAESEPANGLAPLASGTCIGKYQIASVLGQGAFGITYRAYDSQLGREVAIKEYMPVYFATRQSDRSVLPRSTQLAEDFRWGRERFLDEARTLAQLEKAAGVVNVYDFLEIYGTAYTVMELVSGETLEARLKRERQLPPAAVEQLLRALQDGLEHVHDAGFLHRDIKPANIILDRAGRPTLIDFGASRAALQDRTRAMTALYTPGYAAFEQFTSARLGPWTDIYALGATLYHCVTGKQPPVASDRMIEDTLVRATVAGKGRHDAAVLAAIDAALKVKAADRPQSVAEWRRVVSRRSAPARSLATTVVAAAAVAKAGARQRARPVSLPWVAAGGLAAFVLGGGFFVWQQTSQPDVQESAALVAAQEPTQAELEARRRAEEATAQQSAKQQDSAEEHLERATAHARKGEHEQAVRAFTQAIELKPDLPEAWLGRGEAYNARGAHDRAIADFTQAIALRPDFAEALNARGVAHYGKGKTGSAIEDYTAAIRLKPDYAEAFYNRAVAHSRKGDDDHALQDYSEAIRLKPDFAAAFNNRGNLYRARGQYDLAIEDYDQAVRIDPAFAIALKNRGDVHVSKGDVERAIQDFNEAIRIAPDLAIAFKSRGDVHYSQGRYDRAIEDFAEAVRLDPKNAITWHGLCSARALLGQLEQALADCTESLRLRPNDANVLDSRGFVQLKLGHLDEAIADYDGALAIDGKRAVSLFSRGVARLRKGDRAGGRADINAATAIDRAIASRMKRYGIQP